MDRRDMEKLKRHMIKEIIGVNSESLERALIEAGLDDIDKMGELTYNNACVSHSDDMRTWVMGCYATDIVLIIKDKNVVKAIENTEFKECRVILGGAGILIIDIDEVKIYDVETGKIESFNS